MSRCGLIYALAFQSALIAAEGLPITGLAHVEIRVADLAMARAYYNGILGFQEAYSVRNLVWSR